MMRAEATKFSDSLPGVLKAQVCYEEVISMLAAFDGMTTLHRIRATTEVPSKGLVRCDVVMVWHAGLGEGQQIVHQSSEHHEHGTCCEETNREGLEDHDQCYNAQTDDSEFQFAGCSR